VHLLSDLVGELVRDPRSSTGARQILGSEVYIHQSRVNCMPGFKGLRVLLAFGLRDLARRGRHAVPRAVSCSIALTDTTVQRRPDGHARLAPDVHPVRRRDTPGQLQSSLKAQRVGVPSQETCAKMAAEHGIDQFTGAAGDALFFDSNVLHGSGNNITPYSRSNIFWCSTAWKTRWTTVFAAEPRPSFIAGRDFNPLSR